jgi:hypothetical protein
MGCVLGTDRRRDIQEWETLAVTSGIDTSGWKLLYRMRGGMPLPPRPMPLGQTLHVLNNMRFRAAQAFAPFSLTFLFARKNIITTDLISHCRTTAYHCLQGRFHRFGHDWGATHQRPRQLPVLVRRIYTSRTLLPQHHPPPPFSPGRGSLK